MHPRGSRSAERRWVIAAFCRFARSALPVAIRESEMKFFIARANEQDLTTVGELMANGQAKPVIDRRYRLSETAEAFGYLGEGHARGKVMITPE